MPIDVYTLKRRFKHTNLKINYLIEINYVNCNL